MRVLDLLAFAHHLADMADRVSLNGFRRDTAATTKPDGSMVTPVDVAIERLLRREILACYPEHHVVGEELDDGTPAVADSTRVTWIVDPLDGTRNYVWGIPLWSTLIAVEWNSTVMAGVASLPALGERYAAARGAGATRNSEPIAVSEVGTLGRARLSHPALAVFERNGWGEPLRCLLRAVHASRGIASSWGLMLVAAGHLDVAVEPVAKVWDLAAPMVIVEEAGGRLTDLNGRPGARGGSVLASNGLLHTQVLDIFGQPRR